MSTSPWQDSLAGPQRLGWLAVDPFSEAVSLPAHGRDALLRNIRWEKPVQALWPPLEVKGVSVLAELTMHPWQLF